MNRLTRWMVSALFVLPGVASAQGYPDKPVRIIVPFTAGSGGDTVARVVAEELRKSLGGSFVVENRPGAAGQIGSDLAAKAPADGYTLLQTSSATHSAGPWLAKKLPYDPLKDFVHIGRVITVPFLLITHPDVPAKTVSEFIQYATRTPDLLYGYGSATSQVAAATFSSLAKIKTTGVAYKSQPPAVTDLVGGQVKFMMADPSVAAGHVKSGKLRALAITSLTRSPLLPEVPTLSESGMSGFDVAVWIGIGAPAGLPRDIAEKLSAEIQKLGQREEVRQKFAAVGFDLAPNNMADQAEFAKAQLAAWGARIKDAGIQPE